MDAPVKVVHGYTLAGRRGARVRKIAAQAFAGKTRGDAGGRGPRARTLPAAALALDRVIKRLAPERVVFSALGVREGLLYSQLDPSEQYRDPLVEGAQLIGLPLARVPDFAAALAPWTAELFPARRRRRLGCASPSARSPTSPGATPRISAPRRAFAGCCIPVHRRRSCRARLSRRRDPRALRRQARCALAQPPIGLLSPALRRRAQILGRAILLAYRFSGGVPAVLSGARLRIEPDNVRLEVAAAARAPDSEVVGDRLKLLASALGVRRSEIVVVGAGSGPLAKPCRHGCMNPSGGDRRC